MDRLHSPSRSCGSEVAVARETVRLSWAAAEPALMATAVGSSIRERLSHRRKQKGGPARLHPLSLPVRGRGPPELSRATAC